jgi:hypothetical protein
MVEQINLHYFVPEFGMEVEKLDDFVVTPSTTGAVRYDELRMCDEMCG